MVQVRGEMAAWADKLREFYEELRLSQFTEQEALFLTGKMAEAAVQKSMQA